MPNLAIWSRHCKLISIIALALAAFFISVSTSLMIIFFIVGCISFWLAGNWQENFRLIKHHPLSYWICALLFLFILGSFHSIGSRLDILHTLLRYSKFIFFLLLLPIFIQSKNQRIVLNAFLIGAIFMIFMSYCKIFGMPIFNHYYDPTCAFQDHIQTSWEVALTVFILAHRLLDPISYRWKIIFSFIIISFCYYLFVYNIGRSGLLLFGFLFILFCFQRMPWRLMLLACIAFLIAIGFTYHYSTNFKNLIRIAHEHTQEYLTHQPAAEETSEGLRLSFWKHTLQLIDKHPLVGTGTGSFDKAYLQFAGFAPLTTNPHNEYLLFGVQFGLVGIIFLIVWFTYLAFLTNRIPSDMKFIAQGILASYIIGCLFNSWLHDTVHSYSFILLFALLYNRLLSIPVKENKIAFSFRKNLKELAPTFIAHAMQLLSPRRPS